MASNGCLACVGRKPRKRWAAHLCRACYRALKAHRENPPCTGAERNRCGAPPGHAERVERYRARAALGLPLFIGEG